MKYLDNLVSGSNQTFDLLQKRIQNDFYKTHNNETVTLSKTNRIILHGYFQLTNTTEKLFYSHPFSIESCKDFCLYNTYEDEKHNDLLPTHTKTLSFYLSKRKTLDLSKNTTQCLTFKNSPHILSIDNLNIVPELSGENKFSVIENCYSFNKLHISKIARLSRICLSNLPEFRSLKNISCTNHFSVLKVCAIPLKDFSCDLSVDKLILVFSKTLHTNFKSFSNIEKLKTDNIIIYDLIYTCDNVLCLLLSNAIINIIDNDIPRDKNTNLYRCIITKFMGFSNRAEHVMDCAIELIDNNFDSFAEL